MAATQSGSSLPVKGRRAGWPAAQFDQTVVHDQGGLNGVGVVEVAEQHMPMADYPAHTAWVEGGLGRVFVFGVVDGPALLGQIDAGVVKGDAIRRAWDVRATELAPCWRPSTRWRGG